MFDWDRELTTFEHHDWTEMHSNSQGEVEQISLMKPKAETEHDSGLLEYLEDIIGTTGFVEKIEAANVEVEKVCF